MADPIRQALERLLAVIKPKYTDPDEIVAVVRAMSAARTALAAEPPAPAEPDTDAVLALAAIIRQVDGSHSLGAAALAEAILSHPKVASVFQPPAPAPAADPLQGFAADLIASQRPMDPDVAAALTPEARWEMYDGEPAPVADHIPGARNMVPAAYVARLRQCPTHGQLPANAWGCPECLRELREELSRLRGSTPPADGEVEELAQWLDNKGRGAWPCPDGFSAKAEAEEYEMFSGLTRAAALLREARPQPVPVPVAERPWERPGWCDAEGRCWWFAPTEAISGGFRCAGWSLYAADPADEDTHCLPHWAIAIPQPPQANTTHPTPTEPPTDD